jgi:peptide deformylase
MPAVAIRKIAQMGEPVLRSASAPVPEAEIGSPAIQRLIDDMIDTMRDADGAGIAAPQIYEPVRVCLVEVRKNPRYPHFPEIPLLVLINPVVEPIVGSHAITMYEGCLSVSGIRGQVRRPRRVHFSALDRDGRPVEFDWEGIPAAVIQHEVDHLDGVLFVDRALPKTLTFQREYDRYVPIEARVLDPSS